MTSGTGIVLGVDAGGTATRALALGPDGSVLGSGLAGGGNPNSHRPEHAAEAIAEAMTAALAGLDAAAVRACVIGMAGASKLTDPAVADLFRRAWDDLGLPAPPRVASDAEAAFASATSAPDGTVLIAGTGSIAGRIRARRMVSTAGGYGWLLGDEGSGFWIGREAVRSALDALAGHAPLGALARAVLVEALGEVGTENAGDTTGRRQLAYRLITAANAAPPVRLSRFAPLVSTASVAGDPAAQEIVRTAARWLTETAMATREPGERTPVVLVGSVLGRDSPVGTLVRESLAGPEVLESRDGVLGAAWLAAVDAFGEHAPRPVAGSGAGVP
ncbi:N-acetylglucosamine kinase-like BadF-type ATPase [Prauserella shujinwangii]|uniref:N-acetylglucosamine kinase-like BadF-type ATPase n=1 Tax=Prauserella shujinwangii TaxID=1453103 RepID=A0A2T0M172_9PSEU|nr:BadF/BadG/BcrA/BcrD ATPase family protein [Prauserella shujinwangii]PRX50317.1 N-acetylglucosamine kinase-like BadF-type ATPase [Prauserella shujinwangii]